MEKDCIFKLYNLIMWYVGDVKFCCGCMECDFWLKL